MALSDRSETLRWGVLGTARTAWKRTLPAILRANQRIVAIAGRNDQRLAEFKERFGIESTYTWSRADYLIRNENVDAIYIPLPTALHAEWVIRSLEAERHVFCEKPLALRPSEVDHIALAAERSGALVEENYSYYLAPAYKRLEELRDAAKMTNLNSIVICHSFQATEEHRIRYDRALGGGSFLDLGCYGIDFVHRFLKERVEVRGVRTVPPPASQRLWGSGPDNPVDVEADLLGKTRDGVTVSLKTSFVDDPRQSVELITKTGGSFVLPHAFRVENTASEVIHGSVDGKLVRENFRVFDADREILTLFAKQASHSVPMDSLRIDRWRLNAVVFAEVQARMEREEDNR